MAWYKANVELRKQNAIGIFTTTTRKIRAPDREKAIEWLIMDAQYDGYETRVISNLQEITRAEYEEIKQ